MAEHFSIPSQEEAERFSEAYLAAQRSYYDALEDRKEELFAAVRLIKQYCEKSPNCGDCLAFSWCVAMRQGGGLNTPNRWPDPEEGGGEE